jgi:hypothetical protein
MRRLIIFAIVALLGVAPLGGLTVWAQDGEDEAWIGVEISENAAPMEPLDEFLGTSGRLREQLTTGHRVAFENSGEMRAHIPEVPESAFMAIYVSSGEFVLDVMPPTSFIVDTGDDRAIRTLNIKQEGIVAHYTLNESESGQLQNEKGAPCTQMCTVPPPKKDGQLVSEDERTAIQLLTGDWVLAPAGGICVWCLLNAYDEKGTTGELYVYTLSAKEFSWAQAKATGAAAAGTAATPAAQGTLGEDLMTTDLGASSRAEPLSSVAAWAFFNPAPNCRSP